MTNNTKLRSNVVDRENKGDKVLPANATPYKELLSLYAKGKRKFCCANLRGRSFKDCDLSGANFSKAQLQGVDFTNAILKGVDFTQANIRGANFTNAVLTGAKFINAKAGLRYRWTIALVISSWLISIVAGLSSGCASYNFGLLFSSNTPGVIAGIASLTILAVYVVFTWCQGLVVGLEAFVSATTLTGAIAITLATTLAGAYAITVAGASAIVIAVACIITVIGAGAIASAAHIGGKIAGIVAATFTVLAAFAVAFTIAVTGAVTFLVIEAVVIAGTVALTVALFSAHIGRCTVRQDEQYAWMRRIIIAFATTGGTSFRNADLTDADFTSAVLPSTDFRRANLTRTRWHKAKMLHCASLGRTYLNNKRVRRLLIDGEGENFNRLNLRGVNLQGANLVGASFIEADLSEANLQGANLVGASFIEADLSEANLQDANLSGAKLVQTRLDEANLTSATLTGATIEDWGITTHTKLNGVKCEYVFMRVPTEEDPNPRRKPDNWEEIFSDGDFADFIKPIIVTLDLYHKGSFDPRVAAIAFQRLAENHPDAVIDLAAIEQCGRNVLVRAKTAPEAEHSALNAEYFEEYNRFHSLPKSQLIFLIAEKAGQVQSLEIAFRTVTGGLTKVAETSKYNIEGPVYGFAPETTGSSLVSGETVQDNEVVVTQHNYAPEQKQTLKEAAAEIQQLLKQLEQTNPTATEAQQIEHINDETTPKFKRRAVGALQASGEAAIDEFVLENKYFKVVKAAIKGWIKPE